jgi:hypothetical protein
MFSSIPIILFCGQIDLKFGGGLQVNFLAISCLSISYFLFFLTASFNSFVIVNVISSPFQVESGHLGVGCPKHEFYPLMIEILNSLQSIGSRQGLELGVRSSQKIPYIGMGLSHTQV